MFDEKVDVAEIMLQIKHEAMQIEAIDDFSFDCFPNSDLSFRKASREISRLSKTIDETRKELHDARNIGGLVPVYERFPTPLRQIFRLFSRILRKGLQFAIQDQVNVNSQIDTILSAIDRREELMMQLILRMEASNQASHSETSEAPDENPD